MHRLLLVALSATLAAPVSAQTGISIGIGQPGFYGQLNLNGYPAPSLLYPQPVLIQPLPGAVGGYGYGAPIYLRVPPGHARNWARYCARYGACSRPVYFVQDSWYNNVYVPRYLNAPAYRNRPDYRFAPGPVYPWGHWR
jgi:hypothetical protein